MKKLSIAVATAVLAWSGSSVAGPQGLALSLERGFGLMVESQTVEGDLATQTNTETTFSLGVTASDSIYGTTRLGLDYLMDSNVSIGAGVGFATLSEETEYEAGGTSTTTESSGNALIFAPRVGYVAMLSDQFGLWPRGGITYVSISAESEDLGTTNEVSISQLALTLEAPLMIAPAQNFGFLIAPSLDYGLSYTVEVDGTESENDVSTTAFGIQFGIYGVL